jgi:hypothetical protein
VAAGLRRLGLVVFALVEFASLRAKSENQDNPLRGGKEGKEYRTVRSQLIREGNTPVAQCRPNQAITGLEKLCSMYPEVWTCFVDQPFCRFEWRASSGRRFYTITNRENPVTGRWTALIVSGWNYD